MICSIGAREQSQAVIKGNLNCFHNFRQTGGPAICKTGHQKKGAGDEGENRSYSLPVELEHINKESSCQQCDKILRKPLITNAENAMQKSPLHYDRNHSVAHTVTRVSEIFMQENPLQKQTVAQNVTRRSDTDIELTVSEDLQPSPQQNNSAVPNVNRNSKTQKSPLQNNSDVPNVNRNSKTQKSPLQNNSAVPNVNRNSSEKSKHDGPQKCVHCGKKSTYNSATNQNEKPFSCQGCEKKFDFSLQNDEDRRLTSFQIVSWNIGRGILKKLPEIKHVLKSKNVGICFLMEVDETKKNLQSLIVPNYTIHTAEAENQDDKIRIIALVQRTLK